MIKNYFSKIPVTLLMALITVATGIICGILWGKNYNNNILENFGYGLPAFSDGNFITAITGVFFATPPLVYLVVIPVFLLGASFIEYKIGSWRMLLAFFGAQLLTVTLVSLVLIIGANNNIFWATELSKDLDVGLSNGAMALIGVATATLPVFWRFRARIVIFMSLLAMVLFSGEIADLTHFTGFILGLISGPLVLGRPYEKFKLFKPTLVNARSFVAVLILFYAISHFVIYLIPGKGGLLAFGQVSEDIGSILLKSTIILIMTIFAYGLYKGRRFAWLSTLVLSTILLITDCVGVLHSPTSLALYKFYYMALIFGSLLVFRKSFSSRINKTLLIKTLKRLLIGGLIIMIFNVGVYFLPDSSFMNMALLFLDDVWRIYAVIGVLILVVATRQEEMPGNKELYEKLLKKWGGSTLSWMGTWDGLKYFTNASETAILAFKQEGGVVVVLADPVGSKETSKKLMLEFNEKCTEYGWIVSYFSCSAWVMKFLNKHNYKHAQVAEDTLINLEELQFTGKSWQSVRSSLNKAEKAGVTMQSINYNDATFSVKDQLKVIEDSWVGDKALPEMGFTLGNLKQAADNEVRLNIAIDEKGGIHGMTSWLPVYGKDGNIQGWTLDIMQRRLSDQTMQGVMEFLIARSAQLFKEEGCEFVSLSGAPLTLSGEPENIIEKVLQWAAVKFEPYYGFASLHRFKEKFHPSHEPLYLCYKESDQLPLIGIAIGRAYMNDASLIKMILPM